MKSQFNIEIVKLVFSRWYLVFSEEEKKKKVTTNLDR
jgi:hypothetical protein